jgi:hypothetical protein
MNHRGTVADLSSIGPDIRALFDRRDQLIEQKRTLLLQQKHVIDEMHVCLSDSKVGLLPHTERTVRNIRAAISVARTPGYFQYYKKPAEVERADKGNQLAEYSRAIQRHQNQIDAIDADIQQLLRDIKTATEAKAPPVASVGAWLTRNGHPSASTTRNYGSSLVQSSHVYGGTKLHGGFKSRAVTLKLGVALR